MKSKYFFAAAIALSFLFTLTGCRQNNETVNEKTISVLVQPVKESSLENSFSYSGTIEESETIPLCFSGVGTVAKVMVAEGDYVKKGQLLAVLDNSTFRNTYAMMQAAEKQAEDALKRLTPMYKNGSLPEIKYVEVETGLEKARASSAIAKKNLDDCNLYATIDGYIGKRSIDPGMTAMPNLTSLTIVKINKVFARVSVAENEIAQIDKGQKAFLVINALGQKTYKGIVEEIGVIADPIAHSYKIKIGIANNDMSIKPGMVCSARVENSGKAEGLVIPGRAVLIDEKNKNFVYLVTPQNRALRKYIVTGRLLNEGIQVLEGLNLNDNVVVEGQNKLIDNASVQIVNK